MKKISLKEDDKIFREKKRKILAKQLKKESKVVSEESMKVLKNLKS